MCAGAFLALAALAVGSAEPADADDGAEERPTPDLLGKSLWRVYLALDPHTRLDVHDVVGTDRRVLWPTNWRVRTQHPPPGMPRHPAGRLVVGVLKKGESCPARVTAARR